MGFSYCVSLSKSGINSVQSTKTRFSMLYNNIKYLPPIIGKFLHKLSKIFNKTINHIGNDDIPSTNDKKNDTDGITLLGYLKKRIQNRPRTKNASKLRRIPMDTRNTKKN